MPEHIKLRQLVSPIKETVDPRHHPDLPYVGLEHLTPGSTRIERMGDSTKVTSSKLRFQPGDTIFAKIRPYLNKVSLADCEGMTSGDAMVFRPAEGVEPRYAYCVLSSPTVVSYAARTATGTKMPRADWSVLGDLEVPLPSLDLQHRIADLAAAVEKVARLSSPDVLRRVREGVLAEWWRTHVAHEAELAAHLALVQYGPRYPADRYSPKGQVATIRTTDLDDDGNLDYATMPLADIDPNEFESFILDQDDVLVSRSGSIGIATVFRGHHAPTLAGAFLIRLQAANSLNPDYLEILLNSKHGRVLTRRAAAGGVQKNINSQGLREIRLPIPSVVEQQRLVELVRGLQAAERRGRAVASLLRRVRPALIDDLVLDRASTMEVEAA